jgi:hypothetical protein
MKVPWIIALILAGVVIILILTRPSGTSDIHKQREDAYRNQIAILELEKRNTASRIDSLLKASKDILKTDSVKLVAKDQEIRSWKRKAAQAVARIPQEARDKYPQIDSALAAKDSVNQKLEDENAILRASIYDVGKNVSLLEGELVNERRIAAEMNQGCESRRAELLDEIERLQKKNRSFWTRVKQALTHGGAYGLGYLHGKSSG